MEKIPQASKKCRGPCKEMRELSLYHNDKRTKDGHSGICKICLKERIAAKQKDAYSKSDEDIKQLRLLAHLTV
jgi:hypothetical protein